MRPHAPAHAGFEISVDGWAVANDDTPRRIASPNQDPRPDTTAPTLVVIHNISLPPGTFGGHAIEALFTNTLDFDAHPAFAILRGLHVSSHFLVRRDGSTVQFVACGARAWHAGVSSFEGRERCNDFSIGIELEGTDTRDFESVQYRTLVALVDALTRRYPIAAVAGHSDIAPGRKTDPGPHFDWRRFHTHLARPLRGPHAPHR